MWNPLAFILTPRKHLKRREVKVPEHPLPAHAAAAVAHHKGRRIEVKAGNLGTLMGFGCPIIVRRVTSSKIDVEYQP